MNEYADSELRAGVDSLRQLILSIGEHAEQTAPDCELDEYRADWRDYELYSRWVADTIETNFTHAGPLRKQGFLRALADMFSALADGCSYDVADGDPIMVTAPAFAAVDGVAALLQRHRSPQR